MLVLLLTWSNFDICLLESSFNLGVGFYLQDRRCIQLVNVVSSVPDLKFVSRNTTRNTTCRNTTRNTTFRNTTCSYATRNTTCGCSLPYSQPQSCLYKYNFMQATQLYWIHLIPTSTWMLRRAFQRDGAQPWRWGRRWPGWATGSQEVGKKQRPEIGKDLQLFVWFQLLSSYREGQDHTFKLIKHVGNCLPR